MLKLQRWLGRRAEAAVFGVPDEFYGEEIAAWIQLHPGERATEEEIRAFLGSRLAHFKVPRYIRFVTEFPMTVTGKLRKFRMREQEVDEAPALRASSSVDRPGQRRGRDCP